MTIGQIIKLQRMQNKMTQRTLAARLGVTEDFVSKIESGKSKVPVDKLKILVKVLKLNKQEVLKLLIDDATKQIVDSFL